VKKMKILHVTFDMCLGGTEQVIRQIVENIDHRVFEQHVLCIDGKVGELGQLLQEDGIRISSLKRASGLDLNLVSNLRKYIREQNIDVVHCHQYTPYVYGLLASLFTAGKVVFTEHGRFYPDSFKWKRVIINPMLASMTKFITAISKSTAQALAKFENIPRRKIQVIYNGTRLEQETIEQAQRLEWKTQFGFKESDTVFGTISRLDPIKNQKMMIKAFAKVHKKIPDSVLLMIGDGPLMAELVQLAEALDVKAQVHFTGFVTSPQKYFSIIDVFLLPSLSEGTSMTLLEAMSYETPAIVTDVGGNPEIVVHDETGLVIPNEDESALVTSMMDLARDANLRRQLGENAGRRYVEHFSEKNMVAQYQALYRACVGA